MANEKNEEYLQAVFEIAAQTVVDWSKQTDAEGNRLPLTPQQMAQTIKFLAHNEFTGEIDLKDPSKRFNLEDLPEMPDGEATLRVVK